MQTCFVDHFAVYFKVKHLKHHQCAMKFHKIQKRVTGTASNTPFLKQLMFIFTDKESFYIPSSYSVLPLERLFQELYTLLLEFDITGN